MFFKIEIVACSILFLSFFQSFSQDYDTLFLKPGPDEGKDVLIRSVYPNTNEGDHFDFMSMAGTISSIPFINRSLIEFDFGDIPDLAIIVEAKLSFFYSEQTGGPGHQGENESYLLKITEEWDEHTVTWVTQPAVSFDNPVYLPASLYQFQNYLDLDVTELITDLFNFPDLYHGFSIRLINEEPYRTMTFSSSDQLNPDRWPELEVIYFECEQAIPDFSYEIDEEFYVIFNNQSQNYDSCFWDFGNGYFSSQVNPIIQYAEEGIYLTTLTVFNYCSQNTFSDTIYYCHELIASFDYEINDMEVSFTSYAENALNYLWDFDDGFLSILENPIHTFNEYYDYYVCLTVTNICFETTYCDTVKVISPGGVSDLYLNSIDAYPNPFQNRIKISNPGPIDYSSIDLSLYDSRGIKIYSKLIDLPAFSENELITSKIRSGIYTLIIRSEEFVSFKKLIKLSD